MRTKLVYSNVFAGTDEKQESFGIVYILALLRGELIGSLTRFPKVQRPEFEHLETFSFLPNSGYAFVVGEKSWHGREESPKEWEIDTR